MSEMEEQKNVFELITDMLREQENDSNLRKNKSGEENNKNNKHNGKQHLEDDDEIEDQKVSIKICGSVF